MKFEKLHEMTDKGKMDLLRSKTAILRLLSEIESEFVGRIQLGEDIKYLKIMQVTKREDYKNKQEAEPVIIRLLGHDAHETSLITLSAARTKLANRLYDTHQEKTKKAAKASAIELLKEVTHRPESDSYKLVVERDEEDVL
ncbi:MAG: hypothetical protein V3V61_03360 [Gammaproteobacteria bacterium]